MRLIQRTRDEVRATIAALSPEVRTQVSTEWLALLEKSSEQDPWIHGFCIVNDDGVQVGLGSFKGPRLTHSHQVKCTPCVHTRCRMASRHNES